MDITAALAAAGQALDALKAWRSIEKGIGDAGFKAEILDVTEKLLDVRGALLDARLALEEKDAEIAALNAEFQIRQETVVRNGMRYRQNRAGDPMGLPYCQRCEDVDGRLIRTTHHLPRGAFCPQCKSVYFDAYVYEFED